MPAVRAAAPGAPVRQQQQRSSSLLGIKKSLASLAVIANLSAPASALAAAKNLQPVNKPELLPSGPVTNVIDVAGFLTDGEEVRIKKEIDSLEMDTGLKLRVLAQNYPDTPGLAIKNYWGVDDSTVVFVADPQFGNILNFNVGGEVDLQVPQSFWSRLSARYGTKFYWQERGEGATIVNTVNAIDSCFREPQGKSKCSTILAEFEDDGEQKGGGGLFGMFK